ncbi:FAD-dependent oxidoreductase [Paenibacillus sp. HB172176]|uniref:FAD-dependent oxidoreductase n=1 Tax=Paenibacillus sp. HB172176 TaxID=2493690 RepID=UPI00143C8322|nr:FAD-dependent oxidoreductase [Paenibacillus sp. HB172176]
MNKQSQIVVYGATPCGLSAAIAAARYGRQVTLLAHGQHIGGMMSSGLSITDLRFPWAFGGIFKQFTDRVLRYYTETYGSDSEEAKLCNGGIWFEPHVAEAVFEEMVAELPELTLVRNVRLIEARAAEGRISGIVCEDRVSGNRVEHAAELWIDGSYEGDLAALAGAAYRVGREGREEYDEPYAGFIFLRNPGLQVLEGSTGEGDERIQAYNYRLCLTNRAELRVRIERPADYNRDLYAPLVELAKEGRIKGLNDVIRLAPIPNGKFNGNNRPIGVSLDLPEANTGYPEGSEEERREIIATYRSYMTGLLWFVQHDEELPLAFREECGTWGFPKDEFADNGHIPYEFYVREARRIAGRATFTSHDAFLAPGGERAPIHADSVAVGDYHVDSHIVQRKKEEWPQMEGHVYLRAISKPAQIPYGVMLPRDLDNLLVPGAMSATHLGFSVLRMEPPWSALGQAAGTAAHLALTREKSPSRIDVAELQRMLLDAGQVITFFYDTGGQDHVWELLNVPGERTRQDATIETAPLFGEGKGIQFFGTKGFFPSYYARPHDALTRTEAVRWLCSFGDLAGGRIKEGMDGAGATEAVRDYVDVGPEHPDYPYVARLKTIVDGWLGTNGFYPTAALSWADAARWLVRLCGFPADREQEGNAFSPWSDLPLEDPNFVCFSLLKRHGILPKAWNETGCLEPLSYVTREQFCDMLYRAFDNLCG